MEVSLLEPLAEKPLSLNWKLLRAFFIAASCFPWLLLLLAWDATRIDTDSNFVLMFCWLILTPLSFALGVTAPVIGRLEMLAAGRRRFWWFATTFAAGPLIVGILLTAADGPSLFGTK